MRLLICAGGTGGGVYPAQTALQALQIEARHTAQPLEVLWVGGEAGMEADLVKQAGLPFEAIPAAGIHGVGWRNLPRNIGQLLRGVLASYEILKRFQPEVLLFTGGFVAIPVAVAARLPGLGFPRPHSLLFVPDIEPGLALKTLARFADVITLVAEKSRHYFHGRARLVTTGYPTRSELAAWHSQSGRQALGLSPDFPVLLVFGGSKGSRSINRAIVSALPGLLESTQVVHITGQLDWPDVELRRKALEKILPHDLFQRYHAYPYLHGEMGAALAAADLAVCRSGASTLGELPLFGLPAVLVPYPYAWRYQQVNALYLADHGAAVVIQDAELEQKLSHTVLSLLRSPKKLEQMRSAMHILARPQAAREIAQQALSLVEPNRGAA